MCTNILNTGLSKMKDIIQNTDLESLEVAEGICEELGWQCCANVLLVNKTGRILANFVFDGEEDIIKARHIKGLPCIDTQLNEQFKSVYEAKFNTSLNGHYIKEVTKDEINKYAASILPTIAKGERNGTLVLYKSGSEFSEDNALMSDFCSCALSLVIAFSQNEELSEESRKIEIVKSSINTLSYSELGAVTSIFHELDNNLEGIIVASKIADKIGITRSVIVNALRKLESAGVIESRSLGMKGTFIKVINPYFTREIANYIS